MRRDGVELRRMGMRRCPGCSFKGYNGARLECRAERAVVVERRE